MKTLFIENMLLFSLILTDLRVGLFVCLFHLTIAVKLLL